MVTATWGLTSWRQLGMGELGMATGPGQLFPFCSMREAVGPEDSLHMPKRD